MADSIPQQRIPTGPLIGAHRLRLPPPDLGTFPTLEWLAAELLNPRTRHTWRIHYPGTIGGVRDDEYCRVDNLDGRTAYSCYFIPKTFQGELLLMLLGHYV